MVASKKRFLGIYWITFFVLVVIYMFQNRNKEYRNSEKATAMVIDRLDMSESWATGDYPQFQFSYHDSVYVSADNLTWTRKKKPGETVTVIFPANRPGEAVIYTFVSYWIYLPSLLIGFMIAFFIFAVIVLIVWKEGWSFFENEKRKW